MTTRRIEQLAIILLILWAVTLIPNPLLTILAARLYSNQEFGQFKFLQSAMASAGMILSWAVHIGVGCWLFLEAQRSQKAKWVWVLFGIVFGLEAVVLFVLLQIRDEMTTRKIE